MENHNPRRDSRVRKRAYRKRRNKIILIKFILFCCMCCGVICEAIYFKPYITSMLNQNLQPPVQHSDTQIITAAQLNIPAKVVTQPVPILMFHSVVPQNPTGMSITTEKFEATIKMLADSGYHAVSYRHLLAFVHAGLALPEHPLVITFDDGYQDNLIYAYPILQKYHFCCEISVIASYIGLTEYQGFDITPHFSLQEVAELPEPLVHIESHTNCMHLREDMLQLPGRYDVQQKPAESDAAYEQALREDFKKSYDMIAKGLTAPVALSYPHGIYTAESEKIAKELGYQVTVTTKKGMNDITVGKPDCLYLLKRHNVQQNTDLENLKKTIATSKS